MKYTKIIMMLTLTALATQTSFGMDASVDQVEQDTKGFLADLRAYKKCRKSAEGCPQELLSRLKTRGAYIGFGAAALVAVATGATVGGILWKRRGRMPALRMPAQTPEQIYQSALQETGVQEANLNADEKDLLSEAAAQQPISGTATFMAPKVSQKVIRVLKNINNKTGNQEYMQFTQALEERLSEY